MSTYQQRLEHIRAQQRLSMRRDLFASEALNGMMSSVPISDRTKIDKDKWAGMAFEWADAMMRARVAPAVPTLTFSDPDARRQNVRLAIENTINNWRMNDEQVMTQSRLRHYLEQIAIAADVTP